MKPTDRLRLFPYGNKSAIPWQAQDFGGLGLPAFRSRSLGKGMTPHAYRKDRGQTSFIGEGRICERISSPSPGVPTDKRILRPFTSGRSRFGVGMFPPIPFSPIRTSLYSAQELMGTLDADDYKSFERTVDSGASHIMRSTGAPRRAIRCRASSRRYTTTRSHTRRLPFSKNGCA
jgi:hypothetical protein